jgi:hypothetical protein
MRFLILFLLLVASAEARQVKVLAAGEIASSAVDTFGETFGGIGSGIVWDPQTDRLIAVPDRGAGDGTIPFEPRFYFLNISKNSSTRPGSKRRQDRSADGHARSVLHRAIAG